LLARVEKRCSGYLICRRGDEGWGRRRGNPLQTRPPAPRTAPHPPHKVAQPQDEQQVRQDGADERHRDNGVEPFVQRRDRENHFDHVAKRGVDEPPDGVAKTVGKILRDLAEDEGQRDQGQEIESEDRDGPPVGRPRERAQGDGDEEAIQLGGGDHLVQGRSVRRGRRERRHQLARRGGRPPGRGTRLGEGGASGAGRHAAGGAQGVGLGRRRKGAL